MSTIHSDAAKQGSTRFRQGRPGRAGALFARAGGRGAKPLSAARRAILQINEAPGEALRTLGVAFRLLAKVAVACEEFDERIEQDLVFLGLIGMIDPPRDEARDAVALARGAGIRTMMITGDHPRTAAVIAAELGISADGHVTGAELETLPEDALDRTVRR